jgi:16S rRNA A1518/A1519 N6-dimethyltransferase RsmA/KsgA/DIM1 with predicted DNA glycosylase/AP lyase activity
VNRIHRWLCKSEGWKRSLREQIVPWVLNDIDLGSNVLEIGPGPGLTTDLLRSRSERLTALEIDEQLATSLETAYVRNQRSGHSRRCDDHAL